MDRRQFNGALGAFVLAGMGAAHARSIVAPSERRDGRLFIIGGAEDRRHDMLLLRRFIELCGGSDARIVLITAASGYPEVVWNSYRNAFGRLGVQRLIHLDMDDRDEADDALRAQQTGEADGIFISGGSQRRLMSILDGSRVASALHEAHARGACIAGTSAGAAAMSQTMIAGGREFPRISAGLGLVRGAIIDQHFSQRERYPRLLSLVTQMPALLGVGIDEDTALIIEAGRGLEVAGEGRVTILDNRGMNRTPARRRAQPVVYRLAPGERYAVRDPMHRVFSGQPPASGRKAPQLRDIAAVLARASIR
jgi:cyanophycinase